MGRRLLVLVCLLSATLLPGPAAAERHVVSFEQADVGKIEEQLAALGHGVVLRGQGFVVVESQVTSEPSSPYASAKEAAHVTERKQQVCIPWGRQSDLAASSAPWAVDDDCKARQWRCDWAPYQIAVGNQSRKAWPTAGEQPWELGCIARRLRS